MKQKDLMVVVMAVVISAILSLLASKAIFAPPKNRQQQVDVVQSITTDFPKPSSQFFNSNAFDPTQLITIGQNTNSNPFSSSTSSTGQ